MAHAYEQLGAEERGKICAIEVRGREYARDSASTAAFAEHTQP